MLNIEERTLTEKGKIFNQREILELQQLITQIGIPIYLNIEKSDNSINVDFKGSVYIHSELRKNSQGYRTNYTTSNDDERSFEHKEWNSFKYHIRKWIEAIKRDNPYEPIRKENIIEISPNFYDIFREATLINSIGFKESSGMIFRKALEILVKDFLKNQFPKTYENLLNRKTIGQIIRHFYDIQDDQLIIKNKEDFKSINTELENLKSLANIINNTFKIGNDFSHYERRLIEFSATDMHERIIRISDFVDSRLELKKLITKQTERNREFDTDKL